jgi:porin
METRSRIFLILLAIFSCIVRNAASQDTPETLGGDWGGVKSSLSDSGISSEVVVIGDIMGVVSGGLRKRTQTIFAYQFVNSLDTERAGLWSGGTLFTNALVLTGSGLYNSAGDLQWTSSIDGMGRDGVYLYEAWYEHAFLNNTLTILTGLHEYNGDFYSLDYAGALLNSSFAFGAEVGLVGNSTYPITALGARVKYQPSSRSYIQGAVYDGIPGNPNNYGGTQVILRRSDGAFLAAEAGITSSEENAETGYYKVAIGGWHLTTNYTDFADRQRSSQAGGYLIAEHKLYSEEETSQGLGAFMQLATTDGESSPVKHYFGFGLNYTGLIPGRDQDVTLFGVAQARRSGDYQQAIEGATAAETAYELSYRAPLGRGVTIQPDVQYVHRPGTVADVGHALVVGTRIELAF